MTDKTVTPGGMETLVLLRDECRALSNALELAMVDGYELRELMRRAVGLAGSLGVWVGVAGERTTQSIDERIERFVDTNDLDALERGKLELARFAYQAGLLHAATLRELETERIESARLRDELKQRSEEHSRTVVALDTAKDELERLRGLVGRA